MLVKINILIQMEYQVKRNTTIHLNQKLNFIDILKNLKIIFLNDISTTNKILDNLEYILKAAKKKNTY